MAGFLRAVTYPDGSFALFNDSANVWEMEPRRLLDSVSIVGPSIDATDFRASGYFTWVF
jgi:hypothetical protein